MLLILTELFIPNISAILAKLPSNYSEVYNSDLKKSDKREDTAEQEKACRESGGSWHIVLSKKVWETESTQVSFCNCTGKNLDAASSRCK